MDKIQVDFQLTNRYKRGQDVKSVKDIFRSILRQNKIKQPVWV